MTALPNPFVSSTGSAEHAPVEASTAALLSPSDDDAAADRFVLDFEAFMNDLEPLPALAPSHEFLRADELIPLLQVLARR